MKQIYFVILLLLLSLQIQAQPWMQAPYLEIKSPQDSAKLTNFYEIQKAFQQYEAEQYRIGNIKKVDSIDALLGKEGKFAGYGQYKRWENYMEARVYPTGDITIPSRKFEEFTKYLESKNTNQFKSKSKDNSIQANYSGDWKALGPTGNKMESEFFGGAARVNFIEFDPNNKNIMWTGAPTGGLWKSTDGGANWTTNTDYLSIIGCSDLAINPKNTQIMYLATGDGDGTGSQLNIGSIGVLKTTDGGTSWGSNTMNWQVSWARNIYNVMINPEHPDTVFAATSVGIYRTINAGVSWVQIISGAFTHIKYKPGNLNIIYATAGVGSGGLFYKSTDGGSTFVNITAGLPSSSIAARMKIGVTPADTNLVYLVVVKKSTMDFEGFYCSTDGGNNFTLRSTTPNILAGASGSQAWYNLTMMISNLHKDTIVVGATDSFRSTDGGFTWKKHTANGIGAPLVHPDHHAYEYLPGSDSCYFSGNDGGVWKTTNWGTTWTPMNEGLQIAQMYRLGVSKLNPTTIMTGHQDMGHHRMVGSDWICYTDNTGDGMEAIYENDNDSVIYLGSYNGRIVQAYNKFPLFNIICSNTGSGANGLGSWITPIVMHPTRDSILLVGKTQVWRTTNSGVSFTQVGSISGGTTYVTSLAYAPSNPNYIYAAKNNRVFVSTDGNSFIDRTGTLPVATVSITSVAVSNTDPSKVWVTFSGYSAANKVWKSTDAGVTWSNYSTGLPNLPANCIVHEQNTNDGLYVGTDVGVYTISDTLASWQSFYNGLPNVDVQELEISPSIGKIRAATNGRGLWESDLRLQSALTLNVSTNSISLPAIASNIFSFNITSNTVWSISNIPSWISLSATSGNGNNTITITSQENTSIISRNVVLTITGTGVTAKTVSISQDGATPTLSVSTNTISISALANSTKSFELNSNTNWTVSSSQAWLSASNTIGNGSSTITLTALENSSISQRMSYIVASASGVSSQTISITQDGAMPTLSVSTNSLTLSSKANSNKSFDVLSNTSWTLTSNQNWLSANKIGGQLNSTITLIAQENINLTSRSATVTINSNTLSQIVYVTQDGVAPSLSVSPSTITLDWNDKSTGIFDVISNSSWTITNNNVWLTIDKNSGQDNDRITLTAQENSASISRNGLVSIASGTINKSVFVLQNKSDDLVDVEILSFILPSSNNQIIKSNSIIPKIEVRNNGTKTIKNIITNIMLYLCKDNSVPIYGMGENIDSISTGINNSRIYEFYPIQNLEQNESYFIKVRIFADNDKIKTNDSLSSICFLVDTTKSSVEDNINSKVSIYPNPSNGEINIKSETLIDKIKVTDLLGKIVYESNPSKKNEIINIKLPGVYFVEVSSEGNVITKKIVVCCE